VVEVVSQLPHVAVASGELVHQRHLAIIEAHPDVILWLGRIGQLQYYLPRIREELGPIPVVGGDALGPAETMSDPDGLFPPMHFVRLVDLNARPETRRFAQRFRERMGLDPVDAVALAYDAFSVLLAGIREGARTGEEMRAYLMSLGRERPAYAGITGPVQFNEFGDAARDYTVGHLLTRAGREER
jgi:ABC-type branched-subunit amino acid transport system substrate-binding protein